MRPLNRKLLRDLWRLRTQVLAIALHIADAATHQPFDAEDGLEREFDGVFARVVADDCLRARLQSNNRRQQIAAKFIRNDARRAA